VQIQATREGQVANRVSATGPGTWPGPLAPRYESLTAWRGIACLLVVIYHSARLPGGEIGGWTAWVYEVLGRFWVGVPLFFVISGYCVTASADAMRNRATPARIYFWRRFRRIYPPYWVLMAGTALLLGLGEVYWSGGVSQNLLMANPLTLSPWQWIGNLTLTETWRWHFVGGAENALLPQSWTLCYEEQFYLVVGIVLSLTRRFFFLGLAAVTLGVAILVVFPVTGLHTRGLFLDGHWLMFAAGALVYYAANYVPERWRIWCGLPLAVLALQVVAGPGQLRQAENQSYLAAYLFAMLILGLKPWDKAMARWRILAPLWYCGDRCYSLYLVFWPVVMLAGQAIDAGIGVSLAAIFLVRIPLCVALAVALGSLFHRWVERRFWIPAIRPSSLAPPRPARALIGA
jgi:peptidoglycan/LPS O-acetylase OafA/YrhL